MPNGDFLFPVQGKGKNDNLPGQGGLFDATRNRGAGRENEQHSSSLYT